MIVFTEYILVISRTCLVRHTLRPSAAFANLTHPHTPALGRGFGRRKRLLKGNIYII